jgi:hypothetical protein
VTISKLQTRPAAPCFALAGAALTALLLTACGKTSEQASVPPATETSVSVTASAQAANKAASVSPSAGRGLVVAAPTDIKSPPPGTVVPPNPNAAAEAVADNAKVADLAKQFEADPAAITRQNAACGPANQVVNNLYALSHGAATDELRRFRIACMAKDDAQRELAKRGAAASGGVKNTNSL